MCNGREETLSQMVMRRVHLFTTEGGRQGLLNEARDNNQKRKEHAAANETNNKPTQITYVDQDPTDRACLLEFPETHNKKALERADKCFEWGEYQNGSRQMAEKEIAHPNAVNISTMRDLHPKGGMPTFDPAHEDNLPRCTIKVTKQDVTKKMVAFDKGASGGISGWKPHPGPRQMPNIRLHSSSHPTHRRRRTRQDRGRAPPLHILGKGDRLL